ALSPPGAVLRWANGTTDCPRALRATLVAAALCACAPSFARLGAQGVTTVTVRGTVRDEHGESVDGARVRVVNTATGVAEESAVAHGRFLVPGLEVGGPYTVTVRHIGFVAQQRRGLRLTLGEPVELHFVLQSTTVALDTVRVAGGALPRANAH